MYLQRKEVRESKKKKNCLKPKKKIGSALTLSEHSISVFIYYFTVGDLFLLCEY